MHNCYLNTPVETGIKGKKGTNESAWKYLKLKSFKKKKEYQNE